MTEAEDMLLGGVELLSAAFSTNGTFTVDGSVVVFSGLIDMPSFDTQPALGGMEVETLLRIVAASAQFTAASVTLSPGKRVTHAGRAWVIRDMPYRNTAAGFITIVCHPAQGSK